MEPADYILLNNVLQQFNIPNHPWEQQALAANATAAQIADSNRTHNNALRAFREYEAVKNSLSKQILAAAPHELLHELADDEMGFSEVTPLQMMRCTFSE